MKIAVPSSGKRVCEHFGHCENFNLLEAKDGRRTSLAVNLFEPTQPVFIDKWVRSGGTAYLVTERDGEYEVYNAASSLVLSLKDPSLLVTELPGVCCGTAAEVALDLAALWGLL